MQIVGYTSGDTGLKNNRNIISNSQSFHTLIKKPESSVEKILFIK